MQLKKVFEKEIRRNATIFTLNSHYFSYLLFLPEILCELPIVTIHCLKMILPLLEEEGMHFRRFGRKTSCIASY